jgi:ATP-dependent RNA helicase DDX10/DBP4
MPDFKDLTLSSETQRGLKDSGFTTPTDIQIQTLDLALKGKDVLGAAKTGSGKTLAFLIPVLERLHAVTWNPLDGLGALIITPTRELAYQIFEVMRKVGRYHSFSGGLVIGGKDLKHERNRLDTCNIIVCTPGRILQHMDENPNFHWDQLQILVLDEADKILDMGFAKTMNAIIENLPANRQTLLFSATQTKRVQDLARLSLKKPKFVSAHELSATVTPDTLQQSYLICPLHQKLDMLWSFLKNHRSQKIMVFMASCKQVKYAYELFTKLRPPGHLLALYGSLHQLKRMRIYDEFCRKQNAVLFATDIAARGLDFPAVAWVVQLDCPEDVNTYIHRVGRTARLDKDGHSLLLLLPSEEKAMLKKLQEKEIPIQPLYLNEYHQTSIQRKAEALCARDVELKASAQRAFKSYFKSVHLMRHKDVFNVRNLDKDQFAQSLGLIVTPRVRFLEKSSSSTNPAKSKKIVFDEEEKTAESSSHVSQPSSCKQINLINSGSSDEEDSEELFTKKSAWKPDDSEESGIPEPLPAPVSRKKKKKEVITKAFIVKKLAKKKIVSNKKIVFDEDGEPLIDMPTQQTSEKLKQLEERHVSGIDIELAKEIMKDEDKVDKQIHKKVIQEKKLKRKLKEKESRRSEKYAEQRAVLLTGDGDGSDDGAIDDETTNRYIDELPDPDRVRPDSDQEDDDDDDEDEDEEMVGSNGEEDGERPSSTCSKNKKRKHRQLASSSSEDDEDAEANDWQLPDQDQESLALHLLSK